MSNVNDNNIDDLMRRASEKYPLRTDSADWDRLVGALEHDPSLIQPPVDENPGGRRRRRRFLWLLLLLPLGGLGYHYYSVRHAGGHPAIAVQKVVPSQGTDGRTAPGQTAPGQTAPGQTAPQQRSNNVPDSVGAKVPAEGKERTGNAGGNGGNDNGIKGGLVQRDRPGTTGNDHQETTGNQGNNRVGGKKRNSVNIVNSGNGVDSRNDVNNRNDGFTVNNGNEVSNGEASNGIDGINGTTGKKGNNGRLGSNGNNAREIAGSNLHTQRAWISGAGLTDIKAKPLPSSLAKTGDTATTKNAAAKTKKTKNKQSYFYAGVLAAPDLSMVKFQSVKGVGFTGGILLGYAINHKWAVETGLYLDRKKYYTDGEYFSRKNIPLPSSYNLLTVDGSCNMLEIPINIRYNLGSGVGKVNWFATAGMSSYLMSKEAYNYGYEWNGYPGNSFYAYKQPSRYWFSVINLSFGYEHTLGRVGELRVEPYLRIPTSGIGTGVLPVMSTGVNIGFTHRFR